MCLSAGGSAGWIQSRSIEGEEAARKQWGLLQTAGDGAAEPEGQRKPPPSCLNLQTTPKWRGVQSSGLWSQFQQGRGAAAAAGGGAAGGAESQQELSRLKAELDKKVLFYEEELLRKDSAHSTEIKTLRKDLQESEGARLTANKELLQLRDKLDKANKDRWAQNQD